MKDYLKWLLLIPVFAIVVGLGYLIPKLVGGDSSDQNTIAKQQSQVVQQEIDEARQRLEAYEQLLQKNPNDLLSLRKLGDTYFEIGDRQWENGDENEANRNYKKAVDQYRKYLGQNPGDVEVRIDLGYTYTKLSMFEVALRELQAVTAAAPNNQRAWLSLGYLYLNMSKIPEANDALQKSYNLDPGSDIGKEAKRLMDQASSGSAQTLVPLTPP